ncbi:unnamed protein product [Closterium sp. NIES-64]|nr:unnamed protein product [Closterium sp. NIES-64]
MRIPSHEQVASWLPLHMPLASPPSLSSTAPAATPAGPDSIAAQAAEPLVSWLLHVNAVLSPPTRQQQQQHLVQGDHTKHVTGTAAAAAAATVGVVGGGQEEVQQWAGQSSKDGGGGPTVPTGPAAAAVSEARTGCSVEAGGTLAVMQRAVAAHCWRAATCSALIGRPRPRPSTLAQLVQTGSHTVGTTDAVLGEAKQRHEAASEWLSCFSKALSSQSQLSERQAAQRLSHLRALISHASALPVDLRPEIKSLRRAVARLASRLKADTAATTPPATQSPPPTAPPTASLLTAPSPARTATPLAVAKTAAPSGKAAATARGGIGTAGAASELKASGLKGSRSAKRKLAAGGEGKAVRVGKRRAGAVAVGGAAEASVSVAPRAACSVATSGTASAATAIAAATTTTVASAGAGATAAATKGKRSPRALHAVALQGGSCMAVPACATTCPRGPTVTYEPAPASCIASPLLPACSSLPQPTDPSHMASRPLSPSLPAPPATSPAAAPLPAPLASAAACPPAPGGEAGAGVRVSGKRSRSVRKRRREGGEGSGGGGGEVRAGDSSDGDGDGDGCAGSAGSAGGVQRSKAAAEEQAAVLLSAEPHLQTLNIAPQAARSLLPGPQEAAQRPTQGSSTAKVASSAAKVASSAEKACCLEGKGGEGQRRKGRGDSQDSGDRVRAIESAMPATRTAGQGKMSPRPHESATAAAAEGVTVGSAWQHGRASESESLGREGAAGGAEGGSRGGGVVEGGAGGGRRSAFESTQKSTRGVVEGGAGGGKRSAFESTQKSTRGVVEGGAGGGRRSAFESTQKSTRGVVEGGVGGGRRSVRSTAGRHPGFDGFLLLPRIR